MRHICSPHAGGGSRFGGLRGKLDESGATPSDAGGGSATDATRAGRMAFMPSAQRELRPHWMGGSRSARPDRSSHPARVSFIEWLDHRPRSASRKIAAGARACRRLGHRNRRRHKGADRGGAGTLCQTPEVEGAGGGWRAEVLRPSVGLTVAGGRDQARRRDCRITCRPRERRPSHRCRCGSRNHLHASVRSNICIVNLQRRSDPTSRCNRGAPGRARCDG